MWEHTVGWLVNKVLKELGLKDFIENLLNKVRSALGIDSFEKAIKELLEKAMEKAYKPLAELIEGDGKAGSLKHSVAEV